MTQLEDLLVSGDEINKDLVASILSPFIRVERETGSIIFQEGWERLSERNKVLVYLAARKGLKALEILTQDEDVMPAEIGEATGLVGGTVRSVLNRLRKQRLIDKKRDGGYCVPNWALQRVKDELASSKED